MTQTPTVNQLPRELQISAKDLRHEIQIQSQSTTQDSFGQPALTWSTIRTCFAKIDSGSGREVAAAQQVSSQVSDVITVRWTDTALQAGMRVLFASHVYRVVAVDDILKRQMFIRLFCLELNRATS